MITLAAPKGKYFFSDFLTIFSGVSSVLEETTLTITQLQILIVSVETKRLEISTDDLILLKLAYNLKKNQTPEPGEGQTIDPSILLAKEDKANKVNSFTLGSVSLYPTTSAVIEYVTSVTNNLVTKTTLTQYSLKTETAQKVDKSVLNTLATKTDLTEYAKKVDVSASLEKKADVLITQEAVSEPTLVNRLPMYTLDNGGNYVLCTPDRWVDIGDGFVIPVYSKELVGFND